MRHLIDTRVLLWLLSEPDRLSDQVRVRLEDPTNQVVASAASAWEIAIKVALDRLEAPGDLAGELEREGIEPMSMTVEDALAAGALPRHHDDPFDRMLVAQARRHDMILVSRDPRISRYDVRVMTP